MDEQLSPERILLRLEELRKWQKIQEERLLEQQMLQRKELEEVHNKFYETLSNSSQYETLNSSANDSTNSFSNCDLPKETEKRRARLETLSNLVDGVSALNISRESEPVLSPVLSSAVESVRSNISDTKINENCSVTKLKDANQSSESIELSNQIEVKTQFENRTRFENGTKFEINSKEHSTNECNKNGKVHPISLEEIPILPELNDFEMLIQKNVEANKESYLKNENKSKVIEKKPYLKRGQGMVRFNMTQKDIGLNNQVLPWKKNVTSNNRRNVEQLQKEKKIFVYKQHIENDKKAIEIDVRDVLELPDVKIDSQKTKKKLDYCVKESEISEESHASCDYPESLEESDDSKSHLTGEIVELLKSKQPWASVLTQEQEKYIRLLGETSKYKKYFNPDGSECSSIVASPNFIKIKDNREIAEQRMFEMLEQKVDSSSFCSNGSFIQRIISLKNDNNNKGADTPTLNKEYLKAFPQVLNLKPSLSDLETVEDLNTSQSCVDDKDTLKEDTDVDDYTDSTDSEPTCKEIIKQKGGILTSTPNQIPKVSQNEYCVHTSSKDKNKVIKIVISEDTNAEDDTKLTSCLNNDDKTIVQNDESCYLEDMTDKAEMLKARLQDLQTEIEVFKRENEAVLKLKSELEEEREKFFKERAEAERKFNEDKIVAEYYLAEEKEKLAKQKALYDRHVKDMKNQSARKDREEIALLKKEIDDLKEQIKLKDAKNGAAQARLRNQIKYLEKDKDEFKFENEKLKKDNGRLQNINLRSRRLSNIKCLAEINKTLSQNAINDKNDDVEIVDVYPNKIISGGCFSERSKKVKQSVTKPTVVKHDKPFKRTKSAPDLTSRYAKYFSKRDEEEKRYAREELGYGLDSDSEDQISNDGESDDEQVYKKDIFENRKSLNKTTDGNFFSDDRLKGQKSLHRLVRQTPEYPEVDYYERKSNKLPSKSYTTDNSKYSKETTSKYAERDLDFEKQYVDIDKFDKKESDAKSQQSSSDFCPSVSGKSDFKDSNKNDLRNNSLDHVVIVREDGGKEVRFTNGNTKIISADGSYSKFLYYNGDVKETFYKEGTIKYFYKEVNVHHTTYKDGSQLLQFPDGQVERRYPDGSVESQLSDGATRWARVGGVQEWKFPDGTVLVVSPNGDRTLRFPNGQVEIHTKEYKRREFPDGTVKVVYADGVVETRFANGRIRVKDKQDRVYLDSAGTNNYVKQTQI